MRPTRLGDAYHIERALATRQEFPDIHVVAKKCHGFKSQFVQTVKTYHRKYGYDSKLTKPLMGTQAVPFVGKELLQNIQGRHTKLFF
ncbi:hypothetical protein KC19_VG243300 [Ceratodon purpureus]|uniref:Uncharacterized protein n=1 Tax=Ceratodon purpureus TaxID=3225 RepID=A0A8T0HTW1_CERPU|nr:hypothetical protein KC19_VG243300 [Ceratodon purpureus]